MKSVLLLCSSISILMLLGCGRKMETVVEKDDYGNTATFSVNKKTKLKEGLYKKLDKAGKLYEEAHFLAGKLHGERKLYSETGTVEIVETYESDKFHGPTTYYFSDGSIKTIGQYENNQAVGLWKSYYANQQLKEEVNYENNLENGPFKEYYKNGNIKAKGSYKNGDNEHGLLSLFDEKGQLVKKMNCTLGTCNTTWKAEDN